MVDKETVADIILQPQHFRLERLIEIGAPPVIIERQRKMLNKPLRDLVNKVEGLEDLVVVECEWSKGRGGKPWCEMIIEDGRVLRYFPRARYGPFIKVHNG
jgi:hypothetical protein